MRGFLTDKFTQVLAKKITASIEVLLDKYQQQTEQKLNQLLGHVESLRIEVKDIETRLQSKEIKDRTDYGHVQYKLNSLHSEIIDKKKKSDNSSN